MKLQEKADRAIVVIVGMENNGLGVARSLAMNNIPAIGLAGPHWTPSCETRACNVVYCSSWTQGGLIRDLKSIGMKLDRKAPLIITKDEPVLWISESRKELEDFYEMNLPDADILDLLMSKSRFGELAVEEGWPVPMTWRVDRREELMAKLGEIGYPCILKPQIKNSEFRRNTFSKAFIAADEAELTAIYDMVARWEAGVVIQEWIEGGDERIAYCLAYYDRRGEPVAQFPGIKLRQWPPKCGNTAMAAPAPEELAGKIIELTERIFRKVGFKGIGSMEYKMRPETDEPVIMEPTVGRTDYQSEVAVLNGINIPALAYYDLTDQDYVRPVPSETTVKWIDGMNEMRAALRYWRAGELGLRRWMDQRKGKKKYAVFRMDDLGPFIASLKNFSWTFAKHCVRKLAKIMTGKR